MTLLDSLSGLSPDSTTFQALSFCFPRLNAWSFLLQSIGSSLSESSGRTVCPPPGQFCLKHNAFDRESGSTLDSRHCYSEKFTIYEKRLVFSTMPLSLNFFAFLIPPKRRAVLYFISHSSSTHRRIFPCNQILVVKERGF